MIPCEIFNQKRFPRNSCSKGFAKFRKNVSGGVHLQKSCRGQIFKFTEDRNIDKLTSVGFEHLSTLCVMSHF